MPALDVSYTINAPDVVAEDFNGQTVILNLADGRYFNLEGIATPIWNNLVRGCTPQSIFDSIGRQSPELTDEAVRFIDRLIDLALIRRQADVGAGVAIDPQGEWAGGAPRIDIFDDLQELIFADPIHDVDEQLGWPAPRIAQ
ncbi:MAG: PqqD family protein [Hyphomicrobiales bacterium]|nr:PqqD family protein [Hyphomicrobiales bacterium]